MRFGSVFSSGRRDSTTGQRTEYSCKWDGPYSVCTDNYTASVPAAVRAERIEYNRIHGTHGCAYFGHYILRRAASGVGLDSASTRPRRQLAVRRAERCQRRLPSWSWSHRRSSCRDGRTSACW
eukprot:3170728-Prymnesium_polylepis.2